MPTEKTELWARAQRARDKLAQKFLSHPQVSLIDIGFETEGGEPAGQIVLRIHLRQSDAGQTLVIPEEIDGIPVRVVTGDYRPE
jgi:hypothetical protein